MPSISGTREPNQQRGDLNDMNTVQKEVHWRGGKDADSNVESDLNGRREQVRRVEQLRAQVKIRARCPRTSTRHAM
jgi:hypothetical protein